MDPLQALPAPKLQIRSVEPNGRDRRLGGTPEREQRHRPVIAAVDCQQQRGSPLRMGGPADKQQDQ
jgi:hypothetical protein